MKHAEFLYGQNSTRPGQGFLLEYQRSVLLALEDLGAMDPGERLACLETLERQFREQTRRTPGND